MFASLDELEPGEFVTFVSHLVRAAKEIEVELKEADVLVESAEFRKMYRQEVHRLLTYYERR